MTSNSWRRRVAAYGALLVIPFALAACSDNSDDRVPPPTPVEPPIEPPIENTYEADIVWTEYGIPHISAANWGGAGYGSGYAYAQLSYCTVMREYVRAAGESARYLGSEGNLNNDLVFSMLNNDERIEALWSGLPEYIQQSLSGYAAGLNRYLAETGVDSLAEGDEGCRGAQWVREVDYRDMVRLIHKSVLRGSGAPLARYTAAAMPGNSMAQITLESGQSVAQLLASTVDKDQFRTAMDMPKSSEIGSNAYAVGQEASQTNAGILFGNPHFPWQGASRFSVFQVTVAEEYDFIGGALAGLPVPVIGYNRNVAWSHTVSTGARFTFYELELNPDNPMQYIYDGDLKDLEAFPVAVVNADGDTVEHTFYLSHYGPILDLGDVSPLLGGWPNAAGTLLTYRDANLENLRGLEQWVMMGKASNLGELKEALRPIGIPWVNTIAADRYGDAFYGDISAVPNVPVNKYNSCIRGTLQSLLTDFGFVTMDGSDSDCEWDNDADTAEGVFGYDSLPKLDTRQYGANANDSYWLSNPRNLLTGYSPLIGKEQVEQSIRTRHTFDQAERRLMGEDGFGDPGFNIDNIRAMHYQADNHAAQLVIADVITICTEVDDWSVYSQQPEVVEQACGVLGNWDVRHEVASVGGHIFFEMWRDLYYREDLWSVPFDPALPVSTPHTLNQSSEGVEVVRQALANGVGRLVDAGIAMDLPWGEVQFTERNGERIGIHGGSGAMMFNVISANLVAGEGYSDIRAGNSYMQAVTWDESDCPDAYGMLTYSQSTDPASEHYADATRLYSESEWIDMAFCQAEQEATEIRRESIAE